MFNNRIGFIDGGSGLKETTNGGNNWLSITGEGDFTDMYFIDSLTGWKCYYNEMKKTTNAGLNWISQLLPHGGYIYPSYMSRFSVLNKDTIWGVGSSISFINNQFRGILFFTSNGGNNWIYQLPDTSINIAVYKFIKFVNKSKGWVYSTLSGIHTIVGGDTSFIMATQHNISYIPKEYILAQNYPNPFNPVTKINYELPKDGRVKLVIYDILGHEIKSLVNNEFKQAGRYTVEFNGTQFASGI